MAEIRETMDSREGFDVPTQQDLAEMESYWDLCDEYDCGCDGCDFIHIK